MWNLKVKVKAWLNFKQLPDQVFFDSFYLESFASPVFFFNINFFYIIENYKHIQK